MTTFFDKNVNQGNFGNRDVLAAFRTAPEKKAEIQQGMSPQEIADIVSDRLMEVVKDQFQAAKKDYDARKY